MTNTEMKNALISATNIMDRNLNVCGIKNIEAVYQVASILAKVIQGLSAEENEQ